MNFFSLLGGHFALTEFSVLLEEGRKEGEDAAAYPVSFEVFFFSLQLVVMMYG